MKNLFDILVNCSSINDFKIVSKHTKSCELFYVKDRLETNRVEDVDDVAVTVYVDKDGKRGFSSFTVYPYMNEKDIINKIDEAVFNAGYALNPYFALPVPSNEIIEEPKSNLKDYDFNEAVKDISKAVFEAKKDNHASLNATEIFVYEIKMNVKNSQGVDVSSTSYKVNIEIIPTWTEGEASTEVYQMLEYGEINLQQIKKDIEEELNNAQARFIATPLKEIKDVPVLIEGGENIEGILDYFVSDLSYRSKYQKINMVDVGQSAQGKKITGDPLTLSLVPQVKGAANSSSIDNDGIILHPVTLIDKGVVKSLYGDIMFGYYLNEKHPTGNINIIKLEKGSITKSELKKQPYLRCVKFSSIQLDQNTGFFGGEVRLGFYFDGVKEIPVTGFTISGTMHQEKSTMRLSDELIVSSSYFGPKFLYFNGMKIA